MSLLTGREKAKAASLFQEFVNGRDEFLCEEYRVGLKYKTPEQKISVLLWNVQMWWMSQ